MIDLRTVTPDDIEGIRAVGHAAWRDTYTPMYGETYVERGLREWWSVESIGAFMNLPEYLFLVAQEDGRIIGVALTQIRADKSAMLRRLYILGEYRGQGLGAALLQETLARLPTDVESFWTSHVSLNIKAGRFYTARGFTFDHEETELHGEQVVPHTHLKWGRPLNVPKL